MEARPHTLEARPHTLEAMITMSAFVVDPYHVAYLHTYAIKRDAWDSDEPATTMFNECIRSVMHRYPQDAEGDLPGRIGYTTRLPEDHRWALVMNESFEPGRVLAALACLNYQSCETGDWEQTPAYAYVQQLKRLAFEDAGIQPSTDYAIYSKLPGYSETWEITAESRAT